MAESSSSEFRRGQTGKGVMALGSSATPSAEYWTGARHFDGSNYAFLDGHVKWLKKDVVEVAMTQNRIKRKSMDWTGMNETIAAQYPIVFAWSVTG